MGRSAKFVQLSIYTYRLSMVICFSKIFSLIQQLIRKHFSVLAESASKIENSKCSPRISILILANFAPINQFLIVYSIFHPLWIALYCLYLQLQFFLVILDFFLNKHVASVTGFYERGKFLNQNQLNFDSS